MLPMSIGIFNQTSAPAPAPPQNFQFNSSYDLISCDNAGVLGPKLSSYDGVLLSALPSDPFATNPNEIVVMPTGNLIQVPAGQQVASLFMYIDKASNAGFPHEIRTIPEVTPTMTLGFCDHVMWTINGNYNTHQARGGAGPPAGAGDPSLTQDESGGEGEDPIEPEDPFDPFNPVNPEPQEPIGGGNLGGGQFPVQPSGGNGTTVDLLGLIDPTTGNITSAVFWQWFAQGARGNISIGANTAMRCFITATNNQGAKISTALTWTAA